MKNIPANKKGFFVYPLLASLLPLLILYTHQGALSVISIELLLSTLPLAIFVWAYASTVYRIEDGYFQYRSTFIKGKIAISTITRLEVGKNMWAGTKPALSTKGIIIKYNQYDEIYVAPQSNSDLVREFVAINPSIEVVNHEKK
ncbi:PH domain-containing protein [Myroides sp. NP-2]|uniref:PH domain-containing protein n=1 Tax=Myroides sp. NP-2 TaxID=2759945 RepID=UPI0015F97678|nr:PH domain-containing protein [Myroides sp. NP-2]MBB1151236.1 PH domain-containing protein [Myroides sp. NP-2]